MSEEDKTSWNDFALPLWNKMTGFMETARELPEGTIQEYGDRFFELSLTEPESSQIALNWGLVDMVFTVEELRHWFFEQYPNKDNDKSKLPDAISIYEYLSTFEKEENKSENKIAIVRKKPVLIIE